MDSSQLRYAVIDLETTGLRPSWHDRIIEVAVVVLDPLGRITDE
ncbi:exonuclease domain-containing protein [Nonomuraea turcica]